MDTFTLVVRLSATTWLGADGPTEDEAAALKFAFRLFPPMRDAIRIEARLDEVCGGIGNTVDIQQGIANTYLMLRAKYEREIRETVAEPAVPVEPPADPQGAIDNLFRRDTSRERHALDRMHEIANRQQVAAEWAVLIIDPPAGWEDIATRPMRPSTTSAVVAQYMAAKGTAEAAAGK